jgi:ABC-2 type transport system ATP-binding protein
VPAPGAAAQRLTEAVRELDAAGVVIDDIALRRPTLDDVFLTLTGRSTDDDHATGAARVPEGASR